MTLCFMIMKKYLREKLEEQRRTGTFVERREYKPYWRSRIGYTGLWSMLRKPRAVFLCGRNVFNAAVLKVEICKTKHGIDEVVKSDVCYEITCQFTPKAIAELERNYGEYENEVRYLIKMDYSTIFFHEH